VTLDVQLVTSSNVQLHAASVFGARAAIDF
jgi:hypothetical protein